MLLLWLFILPIATVQAYIRKLNIICSAPVPAYLSSFANHPTLSHLSQLPTLHSLCSIYSSWPTVVVHQAGPSRVTFLWERPAGESNAEGYCDRETGMIEFESPGEVTHFGLNSAFYREQNEQIRAICRAECVCERNWYTMIKIPKREANVSPHAQEVRKIMSKWAQRRRNGGISEVPLSGDLAEEGKDDRKRTRLNSSRRKKFRKTEDSQVI